MAPRLIDPFFRRLYPVLQEEIANRSAYVGSGACNSYDDYKHQTGYVQALQDVLTRCDELEREQYAEPETKAG
jgi:hypothetical protein